MPWCEINKEPSCKVRHRMLQVNRCLGCWWPRRWRRGDRPATRATPVCDSTSTTPTQDRYVIEPAGISRGENIYTPPPDRQYHFYCVRLRLSLYGEGVTRNWPVAGTLLCVWALFSHIDAKCAIGSVLWCQKWDDRASAFFLLPGSHSLGDCIKCARYILWHLRGRQAIAELHRWVCIKVNCFVRWNWVQQLHYCVSAPAICIVMFQLNRFENSASA